MPDILDDAALDAFVVARCALRHIQCDGGVFAVMFSGEAFPMTEEHAARIIERGAAAYELYAFNVGAKVRLVKTVENYPVGIFDAGLTGTVTDAADADGAIWVRLDQHFEALDEWQNQLQIWDFSDQSPDYAAATHIEAVK